MRAAAIGLLLVAAACVLVDAAAQEDSSDDTAAWRYPSKPAAVANRPASPPGARRPAAPQEPFDSSRYAHRQGRLTLQLPEGATNLRMKLRAHEEFVFGTAFSPDFDTIPAEELPWYLNMTTQLFQGLTPENKFKWPMYEPRPGQTAAARRILEERYLDFADDAGFSLRRGHALEWYKMGPWWGQKLECDAYVAALQLRVTRDVATFKGRWNHYDVFNEVIESPGMLDKCNLWDTAFPDAFKAAHAADPDARLCLNDLSLIEAHNSPRLMEIINKHVWAHDAPIHCIGIQAHFEEYGVNTTYQQEKLDLLATLGLDLFITEFSLFSTWDGPDGNPYSELDEDTQAATTLELFRLWFSHPAVKGIIMWGWWDANIWAKNAGIYTADKRPKKAALAIRDLWQRELSTELEVAAPDGVVQFTGFYGSYDVEFVTASGRVVTRSVLLGRRQPRQSLTGAA